MKTIALFALAALCFSFPSVARATITWSSPTVPGDYGAALASRATCTTGTESAPADGVGSPEQGVSLERATGLSVHLECAHAITAGSLLAYAFNPISGKWNPVADLALATTTGQYQSWTGLWVPGPFSRVAWIPNGLGAVACSVYVFSALAKR